MPIQTATPKRDTTRGSGARTPTTIRLSDRERAKLDRAAALRGIPLGVWLREIALDVADRATAPALHHNEDDGE